MAEGWPCRRQLAADPENIENHTSKKSRKIFDMKKILDQSFNIMYSHKSTSFVLTQFQNSLNFSNELLFFETVEIISLAKTYDAYVRTLCFVIVPLISTKSSMQLVPVAALALVSPTLVLRLKASVSSGQTL